MTIQKIGHYAQQSAGCIQKKVTNNLSHLSKSQIDTKHLQTRLDHCDCCLLGSDQNVSPLNKSKMRKIIASSTLRATI